MRLAYEASSRQCEPAVITCLRGNPIAAVSCNKCAHGGGNLQVIVGTLRNEPERTTLQPSKAALNRDLSHAPADHYSPERTEGTDHGCRVNCLYRVDERTDRVVQLPRAVRVSTLGADPCLSIFTNVWLSPRPHPHRSWGIQSSRGTFYLHSRLDLHR